jgi:hypothetical protein
MLATGKHFETEPCVIQIPLPPICIPLGIHLFYDETYHMTYVSHVNQGNDFGRAFPPNLRRNVYVLAIEAYDPITVEDVLTAFKSCQSANAVISIQVWLVKRNSATRTDIEEQSLYLAVCRLLTDYIKHGKPIPISKD